MQFVLTVKPGSRSESLHVMPDGSLQLKIRARPVDGAANEYLVGYLSQALGLRRSDVRIEKGATSRVKRIWVNLTAEEFSKRIGNFMT